MPVTTVTRYSSPATLAFPSMLASIEAGLPSRNGASGILRTVGPVAVDDPRERLERGQRAGQPVLGEADLLDVHADLRGFPVDPLGGGVESRVGLLAAAAGHVCRGV